MAGQYSPKTFLRHAPNSLLKRYLDSQGVFPDVDWDSLEETEIDQIFETIAEAPDAIRSQIHSDFQDINEIATEGGIKNIIEEARVPQHDIELAEILGNMDGYHEGAFWTFIVHPDIFDRARKFCHADNLPGRSWKKRKDLPMGKPLTDLESRNRLKAAVAGYYRQKEGRGHACHVDLYKRHNDLYWFVYPQDYSSTDIEYDDTGNFRRRKRTPAFEIIFVYSGNDHSLNLFARGGKRVVEDLQEIWGRTILGTDLKPYRGPDVVYDLNPLKSRSFDFRFDVADGVEEVRMKSMRLSLIGGGKKRMTLEADVRRDGDAVYDLLDDVTASDKIPIELLNVTRVRLQLVFRGDMNHRGQTLSFDVTHPDSCNLKYGPKQDIAKKYLKSWGIDVSGRANTGTDAG
jgi:hypothetical protein